MSPLLDAFAEQWLVAVSARSVAATVAAVVVAAVMFAVRRRWSAHAPSYLILVPALVLVAPVERLLPDAWPEPIPIEIVEVLPSVADVDQQDAARASGPDGALAPAPSVHTAPSDAVPAASAPNDSIPTTTWLFSLWALVLLFGTVRLLVTHMRAERRLRSLGRSAAPELQQVFDRLCSDRGFDALIELRVVPGLASPLAAGVLRRSVCVPTGIERDLTAAQLRFVLLHELEHHARRDVLVEGVLQVLRFGFWFHPVAWLVCSAHRRWREFACDEAALARCGSRKRAPVADALFTLIHLANDAPRPSGAFATFVPSSPIMKTRLTRILDRTRAPRRSLSGAGLALLSFTAVGALTVARAQQASTPQDPVKVKVSVPGDRASATRAPKPDGEVAIAVDQGLAWLLASQQADGSWSLGDAVDKPRDHNTVHVTGLALRALLNGWKGPRHLAVVRAVERGDDYLRSQQNDKGLFGGGNAMTEHYGHAQVLRTLAAIQRVIPEDARLEAIQRGVAYAERVRNPYAGWRYTPRDGDNDSKHTALMLLALLDAKELGLDVPKGALLNGRELLKQLTADTGRTGFTRAGEPMSRFVIKVGRFPKRFSEEPTAMRMLVELAFDDRKVDKELLAKAAELVRDIAPRWSVEDGTIDYAYWCFGARAMAAYGREYADVWRTSLHRALLSSRVVKDGTAHWPADDAWSYEGMEAYATASAVLALCALP